MSTYALLGEKLGHSLSPQLHAAIYKQLGVSDATYRAVEVAPDNIADFFAGFAAGAYDGINITEVEAKAKRLNAVNCVQRRGTDLVGYNTDVSGFAYMLRHNRVDLRDADCAILGAGGSAQAVACVLADADVASVKIANRSQDKANRLSLLIEKLNPNVKTELVDFKDLSGQKFSNMKTVVDLIYNPLETRIMREAKQAGAQTINGLQMLVAQAVYAVEIWFAGGVIDKVDMDALTAELAKHFE